MLKITGWHEVNARTENGFQLGLYSPQSEQPHARRQISNQVHITVGPILAAGYAAEHTQVGDIVGCGRRY